MSVNFKEIVSYFEKEHAGSFELHKEQPLVTMRFKRGDHQFLFMVALFPNNLILFIFDGITVVPKDRRVDACILLNRINYYMTMGSLAVNMQNGDIRLIYALQVHDAKLGDRQMQIIIDNLRWEVERYYPVFQRLISSTESPDEIMSSIGKERGIRYL